jgi:hypothetical protein
LTPMWFLFGLFSVEMLWARVQGLTLAQLGDQLCIVILPLGVGLLLNAWGVLDWLANISYYLAFWLGKVALAPPLGYLAATLHFNLLDSTFEAIDVGLGFHWIAWFNYQQDRPAIRDLLAVAYASMIPQILFAIIYFSKPSRAGRAQELWWASIIALVITALVSGVLPALGAYHHYGVWLQRAIHLPDLLAIRDRTLTVLPLLELKGLITLPSYHAVSAVLLAWVYRREGLMFAVACVLNAAMLVSAPVHGGHYLVDVISGCAVAALAIFLVTSFEALKRNMQISGPGSRLPNLQSKSS